MLLLLLGTAKAQYLDTICPGEVGVMYGVRGFSDSYFHWNIEGGEIVYDFGDTVVINWYRSSDAYRISVVEETMSGCFGDSVHADILAFTNPDVDLNGDQEICYGDILEIEPTVWEDNLDFIWHDSTTDESYIVSSSDTISIQVTDLEGCRGWDTIVVVVHPLPVFALPEDTTLCRRDGYDINIISDVTYGSYEWTLEIPHQDPRYQYGGEWLHVGQAPYDQVVSLLVTDANFCQSSDTIIVFHCPDALWEITNVFTPNGDGINESWQIHGLQYYPKANIIVFDRWGRIVFEGEPPYEHDDTRWDGTDMNGNKLPMDSYHYIIEWNVPTLKPVQGIITIVR